MHADRLVGYPLSPQQKHLWLSHRHSPAYRAGGVALLEGRLDVSALETALRRVVDRHEILRTSFERQPGVKLPLQVVAEEGVAALSLVELDGQPPAAQDEAVEFFRAALHAPAEADEGATTLRCTLLRLAADRHVLFASLPAMCADTQTLVNFHRELAAAYEVAAAGGGESPEEAVQYAQFSEWQNEVAGGDEAGREFWRDSASAAALDLTLPFENHAADGAARYERESYRETLDPAAWRQIERAAARHDDTPPRLFLLACWQTLLWRLSARPAVAVAAVFDGRRYDELEGALGLFAKSLPLSVRFESGYNFGEVLSQVRRAALAADEWGDYYDWEAADHAAGDARRLPFGFEYAERPEGETAAGVRFTLLGHDACADLFKLKLTCVRGGDALDLEFAYAAASFAPGAVAYLARQFRALALSACENPAAPIAELNLLDPDERRRLLVEWNDTATAPRAHEEGCFHELFEAQVERTPDAVAVVYENERLTYAQLNARANQLAHRLRRLGVGPDVCVGLYVERSAEVIVALLGILKAGGAYVPFDSVTTKQRLADALGPSRVSIFVTQSHLRDNLPDDAAAVVHLDADAPSLAAESELNSAGGAHPENLLYVIYTSGSTGAPKGVAIEHRQLINYVRGVGARLNAAPGASYATVSTTAADLGHTMIFPALCTGATLHLVSQDTSTDADALTAYMSEHAVDCLKIVPSHLSALLAYAQSGRLLPRLRLIIGGEAAGPELLEKLHALKPLCRILNHYGPTETTVGVLTHAVAGAGDPRPRRTLPLGRPLANTRTYILDARLRPVAVGVTGELYIAGDALARGYLDRPALTAERFIPDPFAGRAGGGEAGGRLYRTGDLTRYLPDGEIEFLGRADDQVKIRGFRIEPAEVEAALLAHAGVSACAVVAREEREGDKRLVAYVVGAGAAAPDAAELRAHLRARLPEYMMPAAFVTLTHLPLTPNGKLDRRALPAPPPEGAPSGHVAPRNEIEELLCGLWAEILGVERVGVTDNFFEAGGHSLLATQLVSRMRATFGVEVALRSVFETPTVEGVAAAVEAALRGGDGGGGGAAGAPPIVAAPRDQELPLSYAQQRLWFLDRLEPGSTFYNVSSALRLEGRLNAAALERALAEVVRRHEVLRTTFGEAGGRAVQLVGAGADFALTSADLSALDAAAQADEVARLAGREAATPFDLSAGPLLRAGLLKLSDDEHVLLLTMHHVVSDNWSVGVLVKEVGALYEAYDQGRESPLAELSVQYADYAVWQRAWLTGEVLEEQLAYWRTRLAGLEPVQLPADLSRPATQTLRSEVETLTLSKELRDALKAVGRREGATVFMLMLAAFKVLLHRHAGHDDITVGTPIANRNRAEIEGLIGFFLNTLVLRTSLAGNPTFGELVARVRETALGAYAHQDIPFEKLVEDLQPKRSLNRTPLFQVLFIYHQAAKFAFTPAGLKITRLKGARETSYFDVTIWVSDSDDGLTLHWEYNAALFKRDTVRRMLDHLLSLLENFAANPEGRIDDVALLSDPAERELLARWNQTERDYPREQRFHELFEAQAARTPHAPAVVAPDYELTYAELDGRATRAARALARRGVGPDSVVALLLDRGADFLTAVLAVFKAGGAYLPLDARHPPARRAQLIAQSGACLVLTAAPTNGDAAQAGDASAHADDDAAAAVEGSAPEVTVAQLLAEPETDAVAAPLPRSHERNLAYVIYTSGSTGQPKGAMVEQGGMLNHLYAKVYDLGLSESDVVAQNASQCFDISVWQMLAALLVGARVEIFDDEVALDGARLLRAATERGVTVLEVVPSLLGSLLETASSDRASRVAAGGAAGVTPDGAANGAGTDAADATGDKEAGRLRWLLATGEALPPEQCRRWLARYPRVPLVNAYGPTECSDDVTHEVISAPPGAEVARVPVGRAIINTRLYVLDAYLRPVPVGVAGELYVGGAGVGRGYLGDARKTAERFLPDPFGSDAGARLYRTGDVARYLPDGALEFLGRVDEQLKVRGYRIEPGEVEAVLRAHAGVGECVVVAREYGEGDHRLVAYVVGRGGAGEVAAGEVRAYLKEQLPGYMVPADIVMLDALPVTPNGKIDKRALPAPDPQALAARREFVAPRTPGEALLADIWGQTLRVAEVGADDDFFELGGHSLLATQVISRIREATGIELPLRSIFEHPTPAALAVVVAAARAEQRETEEDEIFKLLEGLSEDEAQALLERLSANGGQAPPEPGAPTPVEHDGRAGAKG